jgi:type IV secretion system protein VirB5
MAFGGLFLTIGLSSGLVWQSLQSRVVPYVVEVDHLGEARAVTPAEADYRPTDPQIAWHLGRFIANVRSRSLDPVLMRENWLQAYDFATDRGALFLGEYARASNPFADVGRRTVSIQVTSIVRASDTSFQVKWTESEFERGSLARTSHWTAMITVVIRPPRSADTLRKNPLGLYVEAIDWSRELDTPAPAASAQAPTAREAPAFTAAPTQPTPNVPQGSPLDPNLNAVPAIPQSPERNAQ